MKNYEFTVTRQSRWDDGAQIVEISQGGLDYTNPDALVKRYAGEFETYTGMTPAVESAISIAKAWKQECPEKDISIAVGATGGSTVHFDEESISEELYAELLENASEFDQSLPRCDQCGEIMGDTKYGNADFGEYNCCSEYCAEQYWFSNDEDEEEEED